VVTLPVKVWDEDATYDYIVKRMKLHQTALVNDCIPPCSDNERWARPTLFAVKKTGGKRALRVFSDRDEAQQFLGQTPGTLLEVRPGANIRCERFCSVAAYCPQFQAEQQRLAA
jgi:hypothetical protein